MNLTTGYPFFLVNNGLPFPYPKLTENISTDVIIIGGGISGALAAYTLTRAGIACVLVDARTIGLGSTCASTSLLQYELDTPLCKLSQQIGQKKAARAYVLCSDAIDTLEKISATIGFNGVTRQQSVYYNALKKDIELIETEFFYRSAAGFEVDLLNTSDIQRLCGFTADVAILSKQAAITDAYLLTHALLQHSIKKGLQVFDRTRVSQIQYGKKSVQVKTNSGNTLRAAYIVNATGYEVTEFIEKKIVQLTSTYAFATEQTIEDFPFIENNTMVWNTGDPYLYMRTSQDNRIILGGRDEEFFSPRRRDKLIKKKTKGLHNDFKKLFPHSQLTPEFNWTGTFGITSDSLPYIGMYSKTPRTYYALGFGGNGITFSMIAAEIICDLLLGKKNTDAELFSFTR